MNEQLVDFLRSFSSTNDWIGILPEILLGLLALIVLGAEILLPKNRQNVIPQIAILGQLAVLIFSFLDYGWASYDARTSFNGLIFQTDLTQLMRGFFLFSSILVCYLGEQYLKKQLLARTEFYALVIIVAAAMMLLVQSANFLMLFVALETVTVAFYVLVAYCRTSAFSLEAGLKYLILGAMSSAILLFGIVLLYGIGGNPALVGASTNSLDYSSLANFILLNSDNSLVRVGALLVIAGICFKIGAVPFQIWVPDVYQGAPTPVTAFLAVASKAAGFVVLIQLIQGPFAGLSELLVPVLTFIAAISILFGNVAAIAQRNVKRMMGLSGVAHAGYLLVGVIASLQVPWAAYAVAFYLFTYLLASFAVFGVMTLHATSEDAFQSLDDYRNFSKTHPFLSAVLTVGLGSLAGIPPLGGFVGKLFIFVAAFQAELYGLLAVSIVGVVISIYYYFGWVRECYFSFPTASEPEPAALPIASSSRLLFGGLMIASIAVGLVPALLPIVR